MAEHTRPENYGPYVGIVHATTSTAAEAIANNMSYAVAQLGYIARSVSISVDHSNGSTYLITMLYDDLSRFPRDTKVAFYVAHPEWVFESGLRKDAGVIPPFRFGESGLIMGGK